MVRMGTRKNPELTLNSYYCNRRDIYLLQEIWYGRFSWTNDRKSYDAYAGGTVLHGIWGGWRGQCSEKWKVVRSGAQEVTRDT